ncbi:MAG: diaminopimelate decarboxylase [Deltaproteobacteria bacterium]|nr:MAG: diaminopimelate decarboxylase [Deltaproteobacteria bacterium]
MAGSFADKPRISDVQGVLAHPDRFGVRYRDGDADAGCRELLLDAIPLGALADVVKTPTYVYGLAHVDRAIDDLAAALRGADAGICYAVKANDTHAVLRRMADRGVGADIVSGGELARAVRAGIAPDDIVFSGVGKRPDEIDAALGHGIASINVESGAELAVVAARARAAGLRARVSLRLNPEISADTHPYLATGLAEAKFGVPLDAAAPLAKRCLEDPHLELVGIACHIGSQIFDADPFVESVRSLARVVEELRALGASLRRFDLGGGFAIPYTGDQAPMDLDAWAAAVRPVAADLGLRLIVEPGRLLVGNAGVLLVRVLYCKDNGARRFVVVDGAMNDLIRPSLYDAYHMIVPTRLRQGAKDVTVDVVGPVCETGDFFALERSMPEVRPGDVLAVLSAGAYGATMASTYNTRPLSAEVVVEGERFAVCRRRQTLEALLARDVVDPVFEALPAT